MIIAAIVAILIIGAAFGVSYFLNELLNYRREK
jgi:hypothetical protein